MNSDLVSSSKTGHGSRSDRKIRVVRIIDRLNIGGPARHVVWLTAGLDPEHFETTLVTGTVPPGEGDMSYFARDNCVEPIVIDKMSRELGLGDIIVTLKLLGLLFRIRPDIVHTHKSKAGAAGRIAAFLYRWMTLSALILRPRKCRIVHTFHGHIFRGYYGRFKTAVFVEIERILARLSTDRILVLSEQQRQEICGEFKVGRPDQFRVVPLGIDFAEAETGVIPALKAELGLSERDLVVGIVGRLCEVKNHSMFLEAAARLLQRRAGCEQQVRFVVIGDGHLRPELEERARKLGIQDQVSFIGFRKDANRLYRELDLVALTSVNEGTPLTLIEAMAQERAVISTRVGGVQDIFGGQLYSRDGFAVCEHGVTTDTGDVDSFARGMEFLLERPQLRDDMGKRGRSFVAAGFSRDRLIDDIEELYLDLAGSAPRSATQLADAVEVPQAAGMR